MCRERNEGGCEEYGRDGSDAGIWEKCVCEEGGVCVKSSGPVMEGVRALDTLARVMWFRPGEVTGWCLQNQKCNCNLHNAGFPSGERAQGSGVGADTVGIRGCYIQFPPGQCSVDYLREDTAHPVTPKPLHKP